MCPVRAIVFFVAFPTTHQPSHTSPHSASNQPIMSAQPVTFSPRLSTDNAHGHQRMPPSRRPTYYHQPFVVNCTSQLCMLPLPLLTLPILSHASVRLHPSTVTASPRSRALYMFAPSCHGHPGRLSKHVSEGRSFRFIATCALVCRAACIAMHACRLG